MREKLASIEGERTEWSGTFSRYGRKTAFRGPPLQTVLLVDVKDAAGNPACDHLWFNFTKEFAALELQAGERVKFTARVKGYWKGYGGAENQTRDLKLDRPAKIRRVDAKPAADLPLFMEGNQIRLL
jgi:hypothetical protein